MPHISDKNPRSPTPSSVRHPAGASSPTTSSTATPRHPSSTVPDEDPSSISSSRRFSHPILHLQGAAPMFPSSFAPPPFPHHRLHLHHRKSIIITVSSDEAAAQSAPAKRLYTNRHIFFLIRSHSAAGARSRADTATPSTAASPATSSTASLPRWRRPHQ